MDFAKMCSRLDPRCYKAFLAVVSEGSFSAAASSAAMTVSGVSQHIANIESAVGAQLFLRTASGCKLTDPGRRFHQFVKSYSNLLADFLIRKRVIFPRIPRRILLKTFKSYTLS